ncbi:hypothetical protein RQP46_003476 [Phenoliferia psychrophenolica]
MDLSSGTFAYGGLRFVYAPGTDYNFFTKDPQQLLLSGDYAKVPVINGGNDDEGTLFSLVQANVTTEADFLAYLSGVYLPLANSSEIAAVAAAYPADPAAGSPFNTSALSELYPNFKRISAVQGDISFQATRRFLLSIIHETQPAWSFLYKRQKLTPFLGSFHVSDLEVETVPSDAAPPPDFTYYDSLINLAVFLDPNNPRDRADGVSPLSGIHWPKWTPGGALLTYVDAESDPVGATANPTTIPGGVVATPPRGLVLTMDTFRGDAMALLNRLFLKYPF